MALPPGEKHFTIIVQMEPTLECVAEASQSLSLQEFVFALANVQACVWACTRAYARLAHIDPQSFADAVVLGAGELMRQGETKATLVEDHGS